MSVNQRKLMGLDNPGAQRVQIRVADWNALKLAVWRSKWGWDIVARTVTEIIERCAHVDGCPGKDDAREPCVAPRYERTTDDSGKVTGSRLVAPGCPDRELRMNALVILNATRHLAPIDARKLANEPYFAPTRERFCEVIAELAAAQAELDALHATGARAEPSPNPTPALPTPREPVPLDGMFDSTPPAEDDEGENNSEEIET